MVVATDGGVECATPARPDRRDERGGDRSGDAETPVRGDVNARVQGEPDRGVRVTDFFGRDENGVDDDD